MPVKDPGDLWPVSSVGTSHSCSADTARQGGNSPHIGTCDFQVESESLHLFYIRSLMGGKGGLLITDAAAYRCAGEHPQTILIPGKPHLAIQDHVLLWGDALRMGSTDRCGCWVIGEQTALIPSSKSMSSALC